MSNAVTVREESRAITVAQERKATADRIGTELVERLPAILPNGMSPDRFKAVTMQAIAKNPELLECEASSVVMAVLEAAQLGLEPTGSLSRAWLVAYNENVGTKDNKIWVKKAQLMIGFQGLADLARRSGEIVKISSRVVYAGDEFAVEYGSSERIVHIPLLETSDPTKITHFYAIALLKDGTQQFDVMTKAQVDMIRARSKMANFGAWVSDYAEMGRKTILRRLSKSLPLTTEAIEAIARDDDREFAGTAPAQIPANTRTASVRDALAKRLSPGQPAQDDLQQPEASGQPNDALPAASASQQPEQAGTADSKPKAKPVVKVTKPDPAPVAVEEDEVVEVPKDWKPAKCGAQSDAQLGPVLSCVLLPAHQSIDKRPSPHEGPDGSKWPNR